jgi:hypothetical protein
VDAEIDAADADHPDQQHRHAEHKAAHPPATDDREQQGRQRQIDDRAVGGVAAREAARRLVHQPPDQIGARAFDQRLDQGDDQRAERRRAEHQQRRAEPCLQSEEKGGDQHHHGQHGAAAERRHVAHRRRQPIGAQRLLGMPGHAHRQHDRAVDPGRVAFPHLVPEPDEPRRSSATNPSATIGQGIRRDAAASGFSAATGSAGGSGGGLSIRPLMPQSL